MMHAYILIQEISEMRHLLFTKHNYLRFRFSNLKLTEIRDTPDQILSLNF